MGAPRTVVVAGATGCVGAALVRRLRGSRRVIALTRNPPPPADAGVQWRRCDLFSLMQCEAALDGADDAVYLVHSMLPSARLTQGSFQDMDLVLADNFARAAARTGVCHIVYLGGLVPDEPDLSRHLRSRFEVEETLGARAVPVTSLRSGIVIGPGSASYDILECLVRRLSIIPCPRWTRSRVQPVALDDVVELLAWCLDHPGGRNRHFDVGSPDVLSYREMLERTARVLGLRRTFVGLPYGGQFWCGCLLRWVTGAPMELIAPLLESTRHTLVARDCRLQAEARVPGLGFEEAVRRCRSQSPVTLRSPRRAQSRDVRSVQRIPLPRGGTARWAARLYGAWLPRLFRTFLKAETGGDGSVRFVLNFPRVSLLDLAYARDRSLGTDRQVFYITGGALAREASRTVGRPRLEFRELLRGTCLLLAIHDYQPTLPWPLYNLTQARLHLWVMRRFARHVAAAGNFSDSRRPLP